MHARAALVILGHPVAATIVMGTVVIIEAIPIDVLARALEAVAGTLVVRSVFQNQNRTPRIRLDESMSFPSSSRLLPVSPVLRCQVTPM